MRDLLSSTLGRPAAVQVDVSFEEVDSHDVCVLRVPAGPRPVFLRAPKQQDTQFVVRLGNSTRELAVHEVLDYAVARWPRRALGTRERIKHRRYTSAPAASDASSRSGI